MTMNERVLIDAINEKWEKKIEDIKAEIEENIKWARKSGEPKYENAFTDCLDIIEKHISTKENCTDCIIDGTDACSKGAGRAINDEICEDFISGKENEW